MHEYEFVEALSEVEADDRNPEDIPVPDSDDDELLEDDPPSGQMPSSSAQRAPSGSSGSAAELPYVYPPWHCHVITEADSGENLLFTCVKWGDYRRALANLNRDPSQIAFEPKSGKYAGLNVLHLCCIRPTPGPDSDEECHFCGDLSAHGARVGTG